MEREGGRERDRETESARPCGIAHAATLNPHPPKPSTPSQAFDDSTTVLGCFKLFDSFEGLLEREIILTG